VTYAAGPVWLAFSHENPGGKNDKLTTLGARFAMGPAVLRAGMSNGTNNANAKVKSYLLGANIRMGAGDIRLGYATLKTGSVTSMKRLGVGYHYDLSKRTKVYATLGRDSATAFKAEPTGFDFGIQHNF
jgi:predicted porin